MGWPALRDELALHTGPTLADGQPSWTLQDPVRNQFFRIDWLSFEILSRWHLEDAQAIIEEIRVSTTLQPHAEDIEAVAEFASSNQLFRPNGPGVAGKMAAQLERSRGTWVRWLIHNYLFFRIPLVKPDRWLTRMQPYVAPFYSATFIRLTLLALVIGCVQAYRNWEQFSATLVDTFSWQGLMAYGLALALVKILHELGHAFTAKRYGCRVPAMGLAFLVMWPVAYTDTNEVWKLADRRKRLAVSTAGVATELIIAVWSTLLWAFLPEGTLKSIAFVLATLTWVATLAINASPFMRFDGYFVLSDWLDMPNLHNRSFALARWDLRERLFALREDPPEYFSRPRTRALILFAYATWIYRLVVFIGIAVLVYHFFIKAAGILLFLIEIGFFILLPIVREIKVWRQLWPQLKTRRRTWRSAALAALVVILFFIPMPTRLSASGQMMPDQTYAVYVPAGAQIKSLPLVEGATIEKGALLVEMTAPETATRIQRAQARVDRARWQNSTAAFDAQQRNNLSVLQHSYAIAEAEFAAATSDREQLMPRAPFNGVIRDLNPDAKPGTWLAKGERLALLVKPGAWRVETYLDEETVRQVSIGDRGRFYADGLAGPYLDIAVTEIDRDGVHTLQNGMLSSTAGGSILVREQHGQLVPEHAMFRVTLMLNDAPAALSNHSWRGKVVIHGTWEAPGSRFVRSALAVIWREAGF